MVLYKPNQNFERLRTTCAKWRKCCSSSDFGISFTYSYSTSDHEAFGMFFSIFQQNHRHRSVNQDNKIDLILFSGKSVSYQKTARLNDTLLIIKSGSRNMRLVCIKTTLCIAADKTDMKNQLRILLFQLLGRPIR